MQDFIRSGSAANQIPENVFKGYSNFFLQKGALYSKVALIRLLLSSILLLCTRAVQFGNVQALNAWNAR